MISIITPVYIDTFEKIDWLNQAINSVLSQSFKEFEIILMDDASPITPTLDTEGDERIRKFKMTYRSGPSLCRNTAAALARYEAILPLDADDILSPYGLGPIGEYIRRTRPGCFKAGIL